MSEHELSRSPTDRLTPIRLSVARTVLKNRKVCKGVFEENQLPSGCVCGSNVAQFGLACMKKRRRGSFQNLGLDLGNDVLCLTQA